MFEILKEDINLQPSLSGENLTALRRFGCFLVLNALNEKLLADVHDGLKALFSLSEQCKRTYQADKIRDPLAAGHSPYGRARALDTGIPNLLETWDINGVGDYWPKDFGNALTHIEILQSQLRQIALDSLRLLSNVKGLKRLGEATFQENLSAGIHLIHYFPVTSEHPIGAVRQSTHEDNTLLTLIPPADPANSPLLVLDREELSMVPILPAGGSCIVQFGSALSALSQGTFPSCVHTILDPRRSEEPNVSRYSTPFFVAPAPETELLSASEAGVARQYGETSAEYFRAIFRDEE